MTCIICFVAGKYMPKQVRVKNSPKKMGLAIEAVRNKAMSKRKAAMTFGVP